MADVDRRVRKTQKHLRDALVELVLERGWDQISVTDVCDRADVGRSTFYVHFADLEDLLVSGFDDLHEALSAARVKASGSFGFVGPLFEHAKENSRLMQAVAGRKSGQTVQRLFRDLAVRLVEAELAASGLPAGPSRHHTARYVSGALVELLLSWLETPRGLDAEGVATVFKQLSKGVVSVARSQL